MSWRRPCPATPCHRAPSRPLPSALGLPRPDFSAFHFDSVSAGAHRVPPGPPQAQAITPSIPLVHLQPPATLPNRCSLAPACQQPLLLPLFIFFSRACQSITFTRPRIALLSPSHFDACIPPALAIYLCLCLCLLFQHDGVRLLLPGSRGIGEARRTAEGALGATSLAAAAARAASASALPVALALGHLLFCGSTELSPHTHTQGRLIKPLEAREASGAPRARGRLGTSRGAR